tara:strand:- start:309 stop:689 length:381 start_codon:yes stop_codon:yes gene_type:complete
MSIRIEQCSYDDIKFIPANYNKEYASFAKRKKKEVWFCAKLKEQIIGCGCLLVLNSTRVRHSNDFIIPNYRGNGFINTIITSREIWAYKNNFEYADVRTVKKYYNKHGYKIIKNYKDGWWLEKKLC